MLLMYLFFLCIYSSKFIYLAVDSAKKEIICEIETWDTSRNSLEAGIFYIYWYPRFHTTQITVRAGMNAKKSWISSHISY